MMFMINIMTISAILSIVNSVSFLLSSSIPDRSWVTEMVKDKSLQEIAS